MARRTVAVTGAQTNGDAAPQSTLAAQIVQNQTRPVTSQQPSGEIPDIRDLLQAVLYNEGTVQETDVKVNAQLVSVLIQTGLVPLKNENLFADDDVLLSLAMDSISVIEATVKRQPEVLLEELTPDGPQLILNLLTALLALAGKPKCKKLPVSQLLNTAVTALRNSINFWTQARPLQEVIRECVDGTCDVFGVSGHFCSSLSLQTFFSLLRICLPRMQLSPAFSLLRGVWVSSGHSRKTPLRCPRDIPLQ